MQLSQALKDKRLIKAIKAGKLFIYPTDTLYGIGCNAKNKSSVAKIRKIKQQFDRPFSVIAPSFDWIYDNLEVSEKAKKEIESKLPGPFTFILKKKNKCVAENVSLGDTLGVRIPKHEFTKLIQEARGPFVTTTVNKTGETPAYSISDVNKEILKKIDYVIDAGELRGRASTIISFVGRKRIILR